MKRRVSDIVVMVLSFLVLLALSAGAALVGVEAVQGEQWQLMRLTAWLQGSGVWGGIACIAVAVLALVLALTACAGAGDWKYEELPGDYAVWRINSREIPLVRVDADGLTAEPVVEGYVYAVAWDENTIYVQQRAAKDKGDMAYYMVALDSGTQIGRAHV